MRVVLVILAVMIASKANAMPWPCWAVKAHLAGKSDREIRQVARSHGIRVTRKLEREVRACLRSR